MLILLLLTAAAHAAGPNLANQASWSDGDKEAFLDYLDTGRGAPVQGQVQEISATTSTSEPFAYPRGYGRKPLYVALEGLSHVMTVGEHTSGDYGPRLLLGSHLFSWMRYFTGFEYTSRVQIPFGIELALIPLGAPHTQNFIVRAGAGAHFFRETGVGLQGSWNLGLGYEWQIAESGFRIHGLADGQRSFGSTRFTSVGLTAGVAYMF